MGDQIISLLDTALSGSGKLIFKGIIFVPADFPTLAEVQVGWLYIIGANVTDNDPTKTNTGQSFLTGDEIVWNGTNWTTLGATALWGDDLTNLLPLNPRDIDITTGKIYKINGQNIFTRSNPELNTTDKAVFGSINELDDRFYNGLQHPTGFSKLTDSEILYFPASQEIRLQPKAPATSFSYYLRGKKYTVSSTLTKTHTITSGLYYFYFDSNNVLQFTAAAYNLLTDVPISYANYSSSLVDGFDHEERHLSDGNPAEHLQNHEARGAYVANLVTDFLASGYTPSPVTPTDADNTFALSSGILVDENLRNPLGALADGGPYTALWRFGSGTDWLWDKTLTVPFKYGTYIQYNHVTGSTWGLSDITNNQYVNIWVVVNPSLDVLFQKIIITPQNVHANLLAARAEVFDNLNLQGLNILEGARIYRFTYRASAAYTSTGKVRIEDVERLSGRSTRITQAGVIEHNALAGLQLAGAGVTWGHINDQDQIIPGIKTFSSLIVNGPSSPFLALGEGGSLTDFSKIMDIGDSLRLYKQSETSTSIVGIDAVAAGSPANLEIRLFENSTISTGTVKLKIWSSDSADKVRYDYDCRTAIISRNLSGTISSRTDASVITNEAQSGFMTNTETAFLVKQWATDTLAYDLGLIKFGTEGNWTSLASSRDSYLVAQTVKDGILGDALSINSDKDALIFGNLSINEFLRFPTASNFSAPILEKALQGVVDIGSGDFNYQYWVVSDTSSFKDFKWSGAITGGTTATYGTLDETGLEIKGNNIWINGVANPTLFISKGGSVNNYISIQDKGPTQATINKVALTGAIQLDINPILMDGSSDGSIRLFRDTSTIGANDLLIYKGDGTPTITTSIAGKTGIISRNLSGTVSGRTDASVITNEAQAASMAGTETAFLFKQWATSTIAYDLGLFKFGTESNWTPANRSSYYKIHLVAQGVIGEVFSLNSIGQLDSKGIRVSDNKISNGGPAIEIQYSIGADEAFVAAYDRDTPAWKPLNLNGNLVKFNTSDWNSNEVIIDGSGNINFVETDIPAPTNGYAVIWQDSTTGDLKWTGQHGATTKTKTIATWV